MSILSIQGKDPKCIQCYICQHCRYKTHPHISVHNFLNIQPIFNPQKVFRKLRLRAFQPFHQYYICHYCWYKARIPNAFNAIYVDTVDTKHIHTFLSITFLIFNRFSICKKFWKADTEDFSTIPSMLYMSILLTLGISISNAFNAIYVKAVDTFSAQYTHM